METERTGHSRFRLAWRWRKSGWTGAGPWVHDSETVKAWLESLSRRHGEKIQHWIEADPGLESPGPTEGIGAH